MSITIKSVKTKEGEAFSRSVNGANDVVAKVGWFGKYPASEGKPPVSVASVAILQERGSPKQNIPPRPFLKPTIDKKEDSWRNQIVKGVRAVLRGATTLENVMEIIGQTAKADIQKTIARVDSPALAESTIKARMRKAGLNTGDAPKYGKKYNFSSIKRKATTGKGNINLIDKPLVDTGYLFGSIINIVESGGKSTDIAVKK